MIASLRGAVLAKSADKAVLEVAGVGYEICMTADAIARLPALGAAAFVHVAESVAMYGGGVTLYAFLSPVEKEMFMLLRDCVPSTGAKKALEYLDKASKSLPDFRRAVLEKDSAGLCAIFGFTRKTADRLVEALKEKIETVSVPGSERLARAGGSQLPAGAMGQALSALSALGYKAAEARAALQAVTEEHPGEPLDPESILRLALKRL